MSLRRRCQRLVLAMRREIDACDGYLVGSTRASFAADDLRRDGCESCLRRIVALAAQMKAVDCRTFGIIALSLPPLIGLEGVMLSRMDSDVLWSLVEHCRRELRPALELDVPRAQPGQP